MYSPIRLALKKLINFVFEKIEFLAKEATRIKVALFFPVCTRKSKIALKNTSRLQIVFNYRHEISV